MEGEEVSKMLDGFALDKTVQNLSPANWNNLLKGENETGLYIMDFTLCLYVQKIYEV